MTRDEGFIDDILSAADRLAEIVEAGRANYDASWLVRSAAERQVEIIGEAVANLSDELRTRRSDLPFRQARALRNIIAHDYGDIDHDLLWGDHVNECPAVRGSPRGYPIAIQKSSSSSCSTRVSS